MRIQSVAFGICVCAFSVSSSYAGIVTTTADSGAGSLRDAIAAAQPGDTIQFDAALNGQAITLTSTELVIPRNLTISGPGAGQLTVGRSTAAGTPEFRIFEITTGLTVTIQGLTISGGFAPTRSGGAIYNNGSILTITNCIVSGNFAGFGGGIFNEATSTGNAQLMINNSTLSGNSVGTSGGGIYNNGAGAFNASVVLTDSTISGNSASQNAGGVYNNGYNQGNGFLTIINSTISGNSAPQNGGGVYNNGTFLSNNSLVLVKNSTISGNSAGIGGGIMNNGDQGVATLVIFNSTISDNSAEQGGGIHNTGSPAQGNGGAMAEIGNTILKAGASGGNIDNLWLFFSLGYNVSSDDGGGLLTATGDQIDTDPRLGPLQNNGGPTLTHALLPDSPAINAGNPTFTPPPDYDQRGAGFPRVLDGRLDVGSFELQTNAQATTKLVNISTRLRILTGDNSLIGGFIVTGNVTKNVIVRAIGPSLTLFGVPGALADPVMELHGPEGFSTVSNDNWRDTQEALINATGLAPSDELESAIVATLPPGAYTAVVRGKNDGIGVGLVEAYDLNSMVDAQLANISTRGFVDSGDNVMIGGFILGNGGANATVLIRAIGPSLTAFGVPNALIDPTLELHNSNGAIITVNDNWRDTQEEEIVATGIAPSDDRESAILGTLAPGAYTAVVRGTNDSTGVALVEVYQLGGISMPTPEWSAGYRYYDGR